MPDTDEPSAVTFSPKPHHINAMRGLLVGWCKDPFEGGSTAVEALPVEWRWIERNVPDALVFVPDLIAAGYAKTSDTSEGDETVVGPTERGLAWAARLFGIPVHLLQAERDGFEDQPLTDWITQHIEPDFERRRARVVLGLPSEPVHER